MILAQTDRLLLRHWRDSDRQPFSAINADQRVMEFMPALLSREESDRFADRIASQFLEHGFGLYAAELREDHSFIGYVGLAVPAFSAHFTPCVEIGWRLSADHWNQGLATEGAKAVLRHAFEILELNEVVSFTVPANVRSRRVMEKLGMMHDEAGDFDYPNFAEDHVFRRHVLYRIRRPD
jgi:RimJ/RimL family protein N-acetyltransferase